MRKTKILEGRRCPKCHSEENQANYGLNRSGTQRCRCNHCKIIYTPAPKTWAYAEEARSRAIAAYDAGASGRAVGRLYGMSKANVRNWIKKPEKSSPATPTK